MANSNNRERDPLTGAETTGHEWDGLKELNNPAPKWWVWVFVITVVWSIGYCVVYPSVPTLQNATKGLFGWSQQGQLAERQAEIDAVRGASMEKLSKMSVEQIKSNPEMLAFAQHAGKAAFKDNCAACHGTGAEGGKGFPNLNDDDWLWGGKLDEIYTTVRYGIRSEKSDNTRNSQMPYFGRDKMLKPEEISNVAEHVMSLSDKGPKNAKGAQIFADNCAICHGAGGEGGRMVGAPRLNDAIWLYGGDKATIVETVTNSRHGVMPAWVDKLDDTTIKSLAIYVHSLGGGE